MLSKKIAQMIGDCEAAIEIAIGDHFWNGDRDRDRDCDYDLNFGDRAHALHLTQFFVEADFKSDLRTIALHPAKAKLFFFVKNTHSFFPIPV